MITLRPSTPADLAFVTALERHADNRELIGQWPDDEHLAAIAGRDGWGHWIIEREGAPAGYLIARDCRPQAAGIYIKRVLVGDKERGTGQAAMQAFIRQGRERYGRDARIWLIVRNENLRAQAVYRKLGFERFDPPGDEARRLDAIVEAPAERCFRMTLLG